MSGGARWREVALRGGLAAALATVLLVPAVGEAQISIDLQSAENAVACSALTFDATITSAFAAASVTGTVNDVTVALVSCGDSCWRGAVPLDAQPVGDLLLIVTFTDLLGNTATQQAPFVKDCPPQISVISPPWYTVAHPWVEVLASCSDDGPAGCVSLQLYVTRDLGMNRTLIESGNPIHTWLSADAVGGEQTRLEFEAQDSRGQISRVAVPVYGDRSTQLRPIATVRGDILDVDATRILFMEPGVGWWVHDRSTGSDTPIMGDPPTIDPYNPFDGAWPLGGYLAPHGAMLERPRGVYTCGAAECRPVVDWRDGELLTLGCGWPPTLVVKGAFAAYSTCSGWRTFYLRDLESGTTALEIPRDLGAIDVSADGKLVGSYYENYEERLVMWAGGTENLIATSPYWVSWDPSTDGTLVAHRALPSTIMLYDLSTSSAVVLGESETTMGFRVRDGWVAFSALLPPDLAPQMWLRTPAGVVTRATMFSGTTRLDHLGHDGELTVFNPSSGPLARRYWVGPGGEFVELGSSLGRAFHQDGRWLIAIGRTLFCVPAVSSAPCPPAQAMPEPPDDWQKDGGLTEDASVVDDVGGVTADGAPVDDDGGVPADAAGPPDDAPSTTGRHGCEYAARAPARPVATGLGALLVAFGVGAACGDRSRRTSRVRSGE